MLHINHAGHSSKAVQCTIVRITSSLAKSVFVNEPGVRKDAGVTVCVIRGTELPVSYARLTTRDTVVVAAPSPAHGIANGNVQCVGNKPQFVSDRPHSHVENLAASLPFVALHLTTVLIENSDDWDRAAFSCRGSAAVVAGFSCW
jgi:hypothetical protein